MGNNDMPVLEKWPISLDKLDPDDMGSVQPPLRCKELVSHSAVNAGPTLWWRATNTAKLACFDLCLSSCLASSLISMMLGPKIFLFCPLILSALVAASPAPATEATPWDGKTGQAPRHGCLTDQDAQAIVK